MASLLADRFYLGRGEGIPINNDRATDSALGNLSCGVNSPGFEFYGVGRHNLRHGSMLRQRVEEKIFPTAPNITSSHA